MEFTGFPQDAFEFFAELQSHNEREWWQANKARYLSSVREPLEALAETLESEFGWMKIFRPYRDVRFRTDKTPYQLHAAMANHPDDGGGSTYFQLTREGIMLGGGYWQPSRERLELFRELVDDPNTAEDVELTIAELEEEGFALGDGDSLKTAPRGYPVDHPRIELLRRRSLTLRRDYQREPWMSTPECAERIAEGFRVVRRWGDWLKSNLA